jgi:hypothetical protein
LRFPRIAGSECFIWWPTWGATGISLYFPASSSSFDFFRPLPAFRASQASKRAASEKSSQQQEFDPDHFHTSDNLASTHISMPFADLPYRGERAAPTFNETQPEELERYFADLQDLFARHAIADLQERKQAAVKYLKFSTERLWKTANAWADATKTYEEFKTEIFKFYPGSTSDRTYTMQDLDALIGQYARTGIRSAAELGEYHRHFLLITRYLASKNRLATQEQSRTYFQGLPSQLEVSVRQRLQIKFVDQHPDDPYPLSDIYEAASYVLACSTPAPSALVPPPPASNPTIATFASAPSIDPAAAQLDALIDAVASLGQLFSAALPQLTGAPPSDVATSSVPSAPSSYVCSFCSEPGHFARECEAVTEYATAGKCKRSAEGKIVLPSGAMVPRWITGACLRDRMEEWHRRNPGQEAATSLFLSLAPGPGIIHLPEPLSSSSSVHNTTSRRSGTALCAQSDTSTYGAQERLHLIQDPFADAEPTPAVSEPITSAPEKRVQFVDPDPPTVLPQPALAPSNRARQETNPQAAEDVHERALEAPVAITQRELFALSPDIRAHVADDTKARRQHQVHAMMCDITDADSDAASDDYSYEAASLRFQEAREASRALWHWQEVDTAARSEKDTGRDALDDTPFFADTFFLGDTFLADSAPQDPRAHASRDAAQAPLAIFLIREDSPSSSPPPPPAIESTQDTARGAVDTPLSAPADLGCRPAALPASDTASALLTAGGPESLDSSISPSARAIKACTQASGAVNTARGISVGRSRALGEVLDDFSLADTFIAQPPALVFLAERAKATALPGHETVET